MATMLGLLGVMLCVLAVKAEVMPQADFDVQKAAGKWYMIGIATDSSWFVSRKASMKMGTTMITATADGDMDMACSNLQSDGTCWKMNHLAKKTDTPGKFTYSSQRWGGDNTILMVDVKYNDYAIIHKIKTKNGSTSILTKLIGRRPTLDQDVIDKFTQFSLEQGIQQDNIAILPKNGECS